MWAHVGEWGNFHNLSHFKHEITLISYEFVTCVLSTNYRGIEEGLKCTLNGHYYTLTCARTISSLYDLRQKWLKLLGRGK